MFLGDFLTSARFVCIYGNVETLGERIRRLRTTKGWTQRQIGAALDADTASVSGWETGKTVPYLGTAVRLANTLGVTLDFLATGHESKYAKCMDV